MSKTIVVIPARFASMRFPGKVIADLQGKPIVQWVYEKAKAAKNVDDVIIAVDDEKVAKVVQDFGGKFVMTKPNHPSGTDRIAEAIENIDCDIIVNVQGDEPLIPTEVIEELVEKMKNNKDIEMGTVAVPIKRDKKAEDSNLVKVIFDVNNFAIYFSRSIIPFLRVGGEDTTIFKHWGVYSYRRDILEKIVNLEESRFEKCEKLEQLRALENGVKIFVVISNLESIGIDTPEDLILAEKTITRNKLK